MSLFINIGIEAFERVILSILACIPASIETQEPFLCQNISSQSLSLTQYLVLSACLFKLA